MVLEVDDIKLEASQGATSLRVTFEVERDTKPYPNNAKFAIWNLNPKHRKQLVSKNEVTVRLEAGYEENSQQIFFGTARRARTTRDGQDLITTLDVGDGEKELQAATISKTFAVGTPVAKVLLELAKAIGLGIGNVGMFAALARLPGGLTLTQPLTVSGPVVEELAAFCRSVGLEWSVQGEALQFLDVTTPVLPGSAAILSPLTGLIGQPRIDLDSRVKKTICVARSLLQPQLVPGALFLMQSELVLGAFAVRKSRHVGDTQGNDWYVDVEGVEI